MKNILLLSGGLDSMVIYHEMKDEIDDCVYIMYRRNRKANDKEMETIKRVGVSPTIIEIPEVQECDEGFFEARNFKMILAVREKYLNSDINVIIGSTANDCFTDNNRMFFYELEDVLNKSYKKSIRITCPLENRSKRSLIHEAEEEDIPFYFCDSGEDEPCRKCHSCHAMEEAGYFKK